MLLTKLQAPEPSGSEKEYFWIFSMYFYGSNPGPPGAGIFLTNLVKDHLPMLHTDLQAPELSSSGEDFKSSLFSNPRPPAGHFEPQGAPLEQTW